MNESHLRQDIVIEPHSNPRAGAPIRNDYNPMYAQEKYSQQVIDKADNVYAPFQSELDWKIAQWAKMRGPGSTAVSELLSIEGVSFLQTYYPSLC